VADDDSALRAILREALEAEGYHVVTAAGGEEALRLLRASDALGMESADHIALAQGDGPIGAFRAWARQFYPSPSVLTESVPLVIGTAISAPRT
jgi:CheY-like chemotaxis protein